MTASGSENETTRIIGGILLVSLAIGEYFAVREVLAYDQSLSGWLLGTLLMGPALGLFVAIPVGVVGCLLAMVKFPR